MLYRKLYLSMALQPRQFGGTMLGLFLMPLLRLDQRGAATPVLRSLVNGPCSKDFQGRTVALAPAVPYPYRSGIISPRVFVSENQPIRVIRMSLECQPRADASAEFQVMHSHAEPLLRAQMFPADFGHLCEKLRRAQGRGPSAEKENQNMRFFPQLKRPKRSTL